MGRCLDWLTVRSTADVKLSTQYGPTHGLVSGLMYLYALDYISGRSKLQRLRSIRLPRFSLAPPLEDYSPTQHPQSPGACKRSSKSLMLEDALQQKEEGPCERWVLQLGDPRAEAVKARLSSWRRVYQGEQDTWMDRHALSRPRVPPTPSRHVVRVPLCGPGASLSGQVGSVS
jgi:hypothetical protein